MTQAQTNKVTVYKEYIIVKSSYNHCAFIYKDDNLIKCIAGDIFPDLSNNAIDKAKKYIDKLK